MANDGSMHRVADLLHRSMLIGDEGLVQRTDGDVLSMMAQWTYNRLDGTEGPYSEAFRRSLLADMSQERGCVSRDLDGRPTSAPLTRGGMTAQRCVRWAWSVLNGRPGDIPASRRALVRDLLLRSPEWRHLAVGWPPTAAPPAGAASPMVAFRFPYRQAGPEARRAAHLTMASASAPMTSVAGADAPVVASLDTLGGGTIELRMVDGVLMRPVLEPDSWSPMGVDAFRRAGWEGTAWVDNPFLPRPAWDASVGDLEDVAFAPTNETPRDARAKEAALQACLDRARGLTVIDGVVHVRAPEPRLHLVCRSLSLGMRSTRAMSVRLAWSLGDLDMFTCQSTDRCVVETPVADLLAGAPSYDRTGTDPILTLPGMGLGLGDASALRRLARDWSDAMSDRGTPVDRTSDECVASFDPSVFPEGASPVTDLLGRLARSGHPAWAEVGPKGSAWRVGAERDGTASDMREELAGMEERMRLFMNGDDAWAQAMPRQVAADGVGSVGRLCAAAAAELDASMEPDPDVDAEVSGLTM